MLITDVKAGDLVHSKLHRGWCLVTGVKVYEIATRRTAVRIDLLHLAERATYEASVRADQDLSTLRNYQFYRDGVPLV